MLIWIVNTNWNRIDKNNISSAESEVNSENNDNPIINSDVVGYTQSGYLSKTRSLSVWWGTRHCDW
jgi:hypothetical protein